MEPDSPRKITACPSQSPSPPHRELTVPLSPYSQAGFDYLLIGLCGEPDHVYGSPVLVKFYLYLFAEFRGRPLVSIDIRGFLWKEISWQPDLCEELPHILDLDPGLLYRIPDKMSKNGNFFSAVSQNLLCGSEYLIWKFVWRCYWTSMQQICTCEWKVMEHREYGIRHTCFPERANPVRAWSALTTMRASLSGTTLGALLEKRLRHEHNYMGF